MAVAARAQIQTITVRSRENTGAGFYSDFGIGRDSTPQIPGRNQPIGNVVATVDGMMWGFLLFVRDGYISFLEGFNYGGESTQGLDLHTLSFAVAAKTKV